MGAVLETSHSRGDQEQQLCECGQSLLGFCPEVPGTGSYPAAHIRDRHSLQLLGQVGGSSCLGAGALTWKPAATPAL